MEAWSIRMKVILPVNFSFAIFSKVSETFNDWHFLCHSGNFRLDH